MPSLGPVETVVVMALMVLPLLGVVDASLLPSRAFRSAGRSKRFWILAQILLGYVGAVIYFAAIRPDVRFFAAPIAPDWEEVNDVIDEDGPGDLEAGD